MSRELFKIYLFKFFDDFVLIYPFYTLMFADFGITPAQIGILLGVWSLTSFVLEVPSGVIADKFSRKHILFFAQLVRAVGYAVWIFVPTFQGFLIGFVLWGIKSAFTSGTYQALIYDLLKDGGREREYSKVYGRAKTLSYIGNLAASGCAALAIHMGYSFVLTMSILALVMSAIVISSVKSVRSAGSTHEKKYYTLLKSGFTFILKESLVLKLIAFAAIAHALGGAIDEYFPIFGSLTGVDKSAIAIFIGVTGAAEALASFYAHKFEHLPSRFFYVLLVISGILFYVAATLLNVSGLVLLVIFSGLYVISSVVTESKIQHLIPSESRATVSSLQGFMVELAVLAVYFGFGLLAETFDYARAFQIFGMLIIAFGSLYLISSFFQQRRQGRMV